MPALESAPTTQREILLAVKDLLIDEVEAFSDENVHISDSDEAPSGLRHEYYCAIWPTGGPFDEAAYVGGGILGINEYAGVAITVYRRNPEDRAGEATSLILDPETGLFELKRQILRAMIQGARLNRGQKFLLIEEMRPVTSDSPREMASETGRPGDIFLQFSTPFNWDLS